jgi:hypothetical protein
MSRAETSLGGFAAALLDPGHPPPPGLVTWNGSDPAVRFAVYRNNVAVSLVEALADTFPVTRQLVGPPFFEAMARCFVTTEPPRSPVLTAYGDGFPDFIAGFAPAHALPYLPDLARLELGRVRAYHAPDAESLGTAELAGHLADPDRLPGTRLTLHPSAAVVASAHAIVALWAAHHGDGRIEDVDLDRPEWALVLRQGDEVLVLRIPRGAAAFVAALGAGAPLGEATEVAACAEPELDLVETLALLIHQGAIAAWHPPGDPQQ